MTLAIDSVDGRGLSNKARHAIFCICHSLHSKSRLTSCTLPTRQSASVLKVGMPGDSEAFKRRVAYSVSLGAEYTPETNSSLHAYIL